MIFFEIEGVAYSATITPTPPGPAYVSFLTHDGKRLYLSAPVVVE